MRKYEGPFSIISKIGNVAYKVETPAWMKKVHLVFHVNNLKPYHPDVEDATGNQLTEGEFKIKLHKKIAEEILAGITVTVQMKQKKEYHVKWKWLGDEETNWEISEDLKQCTKMIKDFEIRHLSRSPTR